MGVRIRTKPITVPSRPSPEGIDRTGVGVELGHDALELVPGRDVDGLEYGVRALIEHFHLAPSRQQGQDCHSSSLHNNVTGPYSFVTNPDLDPAFQAEYCIDPDPDPIRIQGFDDQKLKKIYCFLIKNYCSNRKSSTLQFYYP